ncbi:MAG TPA: DEAD/DEAH box helicase, partial [Anaerolineae bacterium]
MPNLLEYFSPPVRTWFQETFGAPTPLQALGWLPIQRGEHTLILAPTGSGKTLAAFLWGIDELYNPRHSERSSKTLSGANGEESPPPRTRPFAEFILTKEGLRVTEGVRLLYVAPLKA